MVPISAAMAAPTRPVTTSPVRTGAISLIMVRAITPPTYWVAPNRTNWSRVWTAITMPEKALVTVTMKRDPTPIRSMWSKKSCHSHRPRKMPRAMERP